MMYEPRINSTPCLETSTQGSILHVTGTATWYCISISPVSLANCITIVPDWTHIAKPVSTISVIFMRNTCRRVSKNSWTQRMGRQNNQTIFIMSVSVPVRIFIFLSMSMTILSMPSFRMSKACTDIRRKRTRKDICVHLFQHQTLFHYRSQPCDDGCGCFQGYFMIEDG